jgi:hypothetical protein
MCEKPTKKGPSMRVVVIDIYVFAGQLVGIRETDDQIWQLTCGILFVLPRNTNEILRWPFR